MFVASEALATRRVGRIVGVSLVSLVTSCLLQLYVFVGEVQLFHASGIAIGCALGFSFRLGRKETRRPTGLGISRR